MVTEATLGTAPADMDIDQDGSMITGEVSIDFGEQLGRLSGGAAGTVTDTTLVLNVGVIMPLGGCTIRLEGTRNGTRITGTLAKGTCPDPLAGTFTMNKV
jgi:hypothetical protein